MTYSYDVIHLYPADDSEFVNYNGVAVFCYSDQIIFARGTIVFCQRK